MAFSAAGLQCIAVGNPKVWIYTTDDTLTTAIARTTFNTTNCPGMSQGDIILCTHATQTLFIPLRLMAIGTAACSITSDGNRLNDG